MTTLSPRADRAELNLLLNSNFNFFQRSGNQSANLSTSAVYQGPDRFRVSYSGTVTGTPTVIQSSTIPNANSDYSCKASLRRNGTAATLRWEQRIEAVNLKTLVAYLKASLSASFNVPIAGCTAKLTLNIPTAVDNYTAVSEAYQNSFALTSGAWTTNGFESITLPSNVSNGLSVVWEILIPSGTDGTALDYYFSQAMANAGIKVADYVMQGRNIAEELAWCQRYYEKSWAVNNQPSVANFSMDQKTCFNIGGQAWDGYQLSDVPFKVYKRIPPAVTTYSGSASGNSCIRYVTTAGVIADGTTSGASVSNSCILFVGSYTGSGSASINTIYFHWTADAEL